jgi:electron transport complex protein RnfG
MKEIIKIAASLTAVCVAASLILGFVYAKTDHMKREIEEKGHQETIQSLLGYGPEKKAPSDLKIYHVERYVVTKPDGSVVLAYLLPLKDHRYTFAEIDLNGKPGEIYEIKADAAVLNEKATRDAAILSALPKGTKITYAQTLYVADLGDKRLGYVVPGSTQGFKTFIKLMVSLDPQFTVTGVAITYSEEDPGLGDEIKKDFFKNQFTGKTLELLKKLTVIKDPLPAEYAAALDPEKAKKKNLTPQQVKEIKDQHLNDNIYALTGATISSKALTVGVVDTVKKFVYRLDILNGAIKEKSLSVAF